MVSYRTWYARTHPTLCSLYDHFRFHMPLSIFKECMTSPPVVGVLLCAANVPASRSPFSSQLLPTPWRPSGSLSILMRILTAERRRYLSKSIVLMHVSQHVGRLISDALVLPGLPFFGYLLHTYVPHVVLPILNAIYMCVCVCADPPLVSR